MRELPRGVRGFRVFLRCLRTICLVYIASCRVKRALIRTRAATPRILATPQCMERDYVGICARYPFGCARFSRGLCDVCLRFVLLVPHRVM